LVINGNGELLIDKLLNIIQEGNVDVDEKEYGYENQKDEEFQNNYNESNLYSQEDSVEINIQLRHGK
jgi:hypothetical protein